MSGREIDNIDDYSPRSRRISIERSTSIDESIEKSLQSLDQYMGQSESLMDEQEDGAVNREKLLGLDESIADEYTRPGSLSTDKRSRYSKSNSNPQKEYEEEFDEIKVIPSSSSGERRKNVTYKAVDIDGSRRYQHMLAKPVIGAGDIQIGVGKARLYGLLDEKGQVKLPSHARAITDASVLTQGKQHVISKVNTMSKAREIDIEAITMDDEKITFKPSRSKEAERAMRNPRCGYDFLSRLRDESAENVLERLTQTTNKKGMSKAALDALEADYEAKIDKLSCPKCKKTQSFSEVMDKRRICSQCNERFIKAHVSSGLNFSRKVELNETKRQEKIAKVEQEMYGEMMKRRKGQSGKPSPIVPPKIKRLDNAKSESKAVYIESSEDKYDPVATINKLSSINKENNVAMQKLVSEAEKKYSGSANNKGMMPAVDVKDTLTEPTNKGKKYPNVHDDAPIDDRKNKFSSTENDSSMKIADSKSRAKTTKFKNLLS